MFTVKIFRSTPLKINFQIINIFFGTCIWYQVDQGSSAFCTCKFDLSVTVGSMPSGHDTAMVFYTESPDCPSPGPDTIYVGSIDFDIVAPNPNSSVSIINQYHSDCHQITSNKQEKIEKLSFSVFPNPARELVTINISKQIVGSGFVLVEKIGKQALSGTLTHESNEIDISHLDPGVYFLIIDNKQSIPTHKIMAK